MNQMKCMQPLLWKTSTAGRLLALNICSNKMGVALFGKHTAATYLGVSWQDYLDRVRVSRSKSYYPCPSRSCLEVLNDFTAKCAAWGNIFIMLGKPIKMSPAPWQFGWPGCSRWMATVEFPCRDAFVSESVAVTKSEKKKQQYDGPVSAPSKKVNVEGTEVAVENENVKNVKAEIGVEVAEAFSVEKKNSKDKEKGSNRFCDKGTSEKKNEKGESGLFDMEKSQETEKMQPSEREKGEFGLSDVEKFPKTEERGCLDCGWHRDGVWIPCAKHHPSLRLDLQSIMIRMLRRLKELRKAAKRSRGKGKSRKYNKEKGESGLSDVEKLQ